MPSPPILPLLRQPSPSLERLDRLPWQAGAAIDLYGLPIGIRTNDPQLMTAITDHLPTGWRLASGLVGRLYSLWAHRKGPALVSLFRGSRVLLHRVDLEHALTCLETDVELHLVQRSPDFVFVHAGVVGWQGKAIVIPGRSCSGKSTLVAMLCRAGATYYSDEYAVLDARGQVYPFARPLRLRPEGASVLQAAGGLGELVVAHEPAPVGLVVLTRFQPGAHWRPRPLSPGRALLGLLRNTMSARRRPRSSLAALAQSVRHARAVRGPRGDAAETAAQLLAFAGA